MDAAPSKLTLRLPHLYDKQRDAIFSPARYSITEASTKSGKTVGCIAWMLSEAMLKGKPGREFWWVAPIYPTAKMAYRRMKRMLIRADPRKRHWACNESELWIEITASGGRIWFKGADKPDSLYGEDVYAAVIDEGTRVKEEAWHAVRTTLTATKGAIRIIGNVKGRKNWVYRLARKAQAGEQGMSYHKLTAYDAIEGGVLETDEVDDARRQLPDHVFRELYLAEPGDDEGNPFGLDAVRRCVAEMSSKPVEAWGVDLAKHQDWTVAVGLDADGAVAAFQRWQSDWMNTTARLRAMIGSTPAQIDSTGVGDPIVEQLERDCSQVTGYRFTSNSKQQLMEGLASAIQRQEVRYPAGVLMDELEMFEYEVRVVNGRVTGVRYTAPEGMHDDCVCALALAVEQRRIMPQPVRFDGGTTYDDEREERAWLSEGLDRDEIWVNF